MTDYSLVRVVWTDACLPMRRGWVLIGEIEPAFSVITSVGFLVREIDGFVTLASSLTQERTAEEQHLNEIMHIPVGSIRSIKRLRVR